MADERGLPLMAAALFLTGFNLWDESRARRAAERIEARMPRAAEDSPISADAGEVEIPDYLLNPNMEMPEVEIGGNDYIGTLSIPALGLSLPVMSQWSYPKLRIAPCRYAGSAYQGNLILSAHNYSSHFGQIGTLQAGDRVTFTDVDGNVFLYSVAEIQILQPGDVEEMLSGGWALTLFTCTLGGRTRVTVRCEEAADAGRGYGFSI